MVGTYIGYFIFEPIHRHSLVNIFIFLQSIDVHFCIVIFESGCSCEFRNFIMASVCNNCYTFRLVRRNYVLLLYWPDRLARCSPYKIADETLPKRMRIARGANGAGHCVPGVGPRTDAMCRRQTGRSVVGNCDGFDAMCNTHVRTRIAMGGKW